MGHKMGEGHGWQGFGEEMMEGRCMCPGCGMMHGWQEMGHGGFGMMKGGEGPGKLVKKATKKVLIEKMKMKIEARWGDKLDAVAEEMVKMAEEKMKMKKEHLNRKKEMKMRLHEIFAEEMGEEEEE